MNWKTIFSVVIIIAIVGLILLSPKGQKYHGNYTGKYTKPLGSFITGFTSKVIRSDPTRPTGEGKLEVEVKNVGAFDFSDIEIDVRNDVICTMEHEVISFLGTEVQTEDPTVRMEIGDLNGNVLFMNNGNVKIDGTTDYLKVNGLTFEKPSTEFLAVGRASSLSLYDIYEKKLVFTDISGSLTWGGLKGIPALLKDDHLELRNFRGNLIMENGLVTLSGTLDSIRLNGVEISKVNG